MFTTKGSPVAYDPQPFVATHVGDAEEAPTSARPIALYGVGEGEAAPVTWASVTGKPSTFPPTTGTTASTAKPGDYTPTWGEVTEKPSTFPPTTGTTATTAKPGNYTPAWGEVTGKPATFAPATHTHTIADVTGLQAIIDDLTGRIEALEAAAE